MNDVVKKAIALNDTIEINRYLIEIGKVESELIEVQYNQVCDKCGRNCDIAIYNTHTLKICTCNANLKVKTKLLEKIHFFWNQSQIPENLKKCSFENFEKDLNDNVRNAFQGFKHYANTLNKESPKTLTVLGTFGTGKTHLSIACGKELVKRGFSVYFIPFATLMRLIRSSFDKGSDITQSEIYKMITKVDVLILDDIHVSSGTDFEISTIFEILNIRQGKANIFTSNLSGDELTQNKNMKRIKSRLLDRTTTTVLKIISDDYRTLPPF